MLKRVITEPGADPKAFGGNFSSQGQLRLVDLKEKKQVGGLKLAKGTRITLDARYDNSEQNPRNPSHPPKRVRWGEQTTDEMCIAFLGYTLDGEGGRK